MNNPGFTTWLWDEADEYGYTYQCAECGHDVFTREKNVLPSKCPGCGRHIIKREEEAK